MARSLSRSGWRRGAEFWLVWFLLSAGPCAAQDAPLVFLIQPTLGEATRAAFQPLADYLAQATGAQFKIVAPPNFLAHWETVRRHTGYDLVLDDAHFTDYRVQKFRFHVLAKVPGSTSYSLVVPNPRRVSDPLELTGKKVASFGPPSIGATRLNAMFPSPSRRPATIEVGNASEGIELLLQGKVHAAMLPTFVVGEYVDRGRVAVILTTEPTPNMALSVSPRLNAGLRDKIRSALLRLGTIPEAKAVLKNTGFERFEATTAATYADQAQILKTYWGY